MKSVFIYALKDPRDGRVRYIGKTNDPKGRVKEHMRTSYRRQTHTQYWISSLLVQSFSPVLEILDEVPADKWEFFERAYIKLYRDLGFDLTNATDGGDGISGHKQSPEHRAKIGAASRGRKCSAETRAKIGAANRGHIVSPETRAKMSAAMRGKKNGKGYKHSAEARAKISAAGMGRKPSAETREKLSAAKRGKKFSLEHRANISASRKIWALEKRRESNVL